MDVGQVWSAEVTQERIKRALDVFSVAPGSLLYRDVEYWAALAPGNEGQVLSVGVGGIPEWIEAPGNLYESWSDEFTDSTSIWKNYCAVGFNSGSVNIQTDRLRFTCGSGAQAGYVVPKFVVGADSKDQFIQATLVSNNGVAGNVTRPFLALMVVGSWNVGGGSVDFVRSYNWVMVSESAFSIVQKQLNGTTASNLSGNLALPAAGSVLRFEARIDASFNVELEVFDDGVSLWSGTDSTSPYVRGLPGIGNRGNGNSTRLIEWDSLSCGRL